MNTITLRDIKSAKKLTSSQRAVLMEVHNLVSRDKEFFKWNRRIAEENGIALSTVKNAFTFFYKNGILKSKCDYRYGEVSKRSITINYKRLAKFLNDPVIIQKFQKTELSEPTKESPFIIPQQFEDINFEAEDKVIINQWASYMLSELDRRTNSVNPASRELKQLKGIISDALRKLESFYKGETSATQTSLIKDRRVEKAIWYCFKYMEVNVDQEPDYLGGDRSQPIGIGNLNFTFMRNIFREWPEILGKALTCDVEIGFNPETSFDDDFCNLYFLYDGVKLEDYNSITEIIGETPTEEKLQEILQKLNNYFPEIWSTPENEYSKKLKEHVISSFRWKGLTIVIGKNEDSEEKDNLQETNTVTREKENSIDEIYINSAKKQYSQQTNDNPF